MKHSFDWRDSHVLHRQCIRDLDQYVWAPRPLVNLRALGWAFVVVLFAAFLLGLLVVGG